jgi:hypothetical protein
MIQSDALSRRHDHVLEDTDNEDIVLLLDNIFIKMVDLEMKTKIENGTKDDELVQKVILALKDSTLPPIKSSLEDWEIRDGLLFFKEKCYVPPSEGLRSELTRRYHDTTPAGHPGHMKTLELV